MELPKVHSIKQIFCNKGNIPCLAEKSDCTCYNDERYDYCTHMSNNEGGLFHVRVEVPAPDVVEVYDPDNENDPR